MLSRESLAHTCQNETLANCEPPLSSCTTCTSAREHPTGARQPPALHGLLPASPGCADCAPTNTVTPWAGICLAHFLQRRGPLPGMPSCTSFNLSFFFFIMHVCIKGMGCILGCNLLFCFSHRREREIRAIKQI